MSAVEARLAAIEARLAILEKGRPADSIPGNNETPTDTFSDDKLENDWANKVVAKELPRWKGDPMTGTAFADCPAEWHDSASSFYEWKAKKGREEQPVRLKNNGKPWHESDTFTAKLHRTWAKRIRSLAAEARTEPPTEADYSERNTDGLPF